MKTTLREIYKYKPCREGFEKLIASMTGKQSIKENIAAQFLPLPEEIKDQEISILEILESNGVKDAFWALRTQDYLDICLILADIAESVLPIFEKYNSKDDRPRKAIQGIRDYKSGVISKEKLKQLQSAAAYAADTAAAAYAADTAAAYAADTAAAYAADTAAAYAAAYATDTAAAYAADAAAAYATDARKFQWKKNEEILRNYL